VNGSRRSFRANWLDAAVGKRLQDVIDRVPAPTNESGREIPPEYPAGTLQDSLALHIGSPFVQSTILVAVAFDCQAGIA
jgi:hypothetical protein